MTPQQPVSQRLTGRRLFATALVAFALPLLAAAPVAWAQSPPPVGGPAEVTAELTGARLLGSGVLRFLGLRVYDARLWAGAAVSGSAAASTNWQTAPLALELQYLRSLKGGLIAERSLKEMQRQGEIDAVSAERWLGNMKLLFPDVGPGDRITGVNVPGVGARFFFNGQLRGEVREPDFARLFFGIWLSPRTSEPAMREQLLGLQPARPAS